MRNEGLDGEGPLLMLHIDIERHRGMHMRKVMLYRRIEVWKNGRMAGQQNGRMEAFMMEKWNGPYRLPYVTAESYLVVIIVDL